MTTEDIAVLALARATEFTDHVPSTRSLMYRRIGVRQQQLFARAARVNPEYFGICATGVLEDMQADLADLVTPLEAADTVTKIEVANAGTSALSTGMEVRVVALSDPEAELPPRCTIRNRVIRGVGNDLAGVVSVTIHYSRLPVRLTATDGAKEMELPEPHTELLVVDLAKDLIAKTVMLSPPDRTVALEVFSAEEEPLLLAFDAHVREYAGSRSARFGGVPFAPVVPMVGTAA